MFANGDWLIPLVVILSIAFIFFLFLLRAGAVFPYEKIESICTKTELRFYKELRQLVGDDFEIFGKIRIADLLKVKKGTRKRMSWQNKINCKHIDFVLCHPETLELLVAIELDDRSHEREDRIRRDKFVNQAFEDAHFPILRIKTRDEYDQKRIRSTIDQALQSKNKTWVFHIE